MIIESSESGYLRRVFFLLVVTFGLFGVVERQERNLRQSIDS